MKKEIINSIYGYFNHNPEFDQIDKVSPECDKLLDERLLESARETVHKLLYTAGYVDTDSVFTSIERMQSGNIK